MTKNPELLPTELFEWMQTKPFDALSEREKAMVIQHMTAAQYDELHHLSSITANAMHAPHDEGNKLNALLTHFDKVHHKKSKPLLMIWATISTAASAACLIGILVLLRYHTPASPSHQTVYHDTVYLDQNPDTIRIYDTVHLAANHSSEQHQNLSVGNALDQSEQETSRKSVTPIESDITEPNRNSRSRSIRDDSLITKFGFVTL